MPILTINEVAKLLRIHRSTVSRQMKTGALGYIQIGSRKMVLKKDLLSFIENRRSLAANSPKER